MQNTTITCLHNSSSIVSATEWHTIRCDGVCVRAQRNLFGVGYLVSGQLFLFISMLEYESKQLTL